jgi:hypothetical protein
LSDSFFELPSKLESYLAALSSLYASDGERLLQQIIVNAQTRLDEGTDFDNWNGGTHGHTVYFTLPESLFGAASKQREKLQKQICRDLNDLHNLSNENFAEVFFEMGRPESGDWRQESGLLLTSKRTVAPDSAKRVWGDEGYRVFLSHKSEVKKQVGELRDNLKVFGVSAFVAHEDIKPTRAWQDEIENALHTMDAFVALMTEGFHNSDWTDQEVGFALARGVPVIAVRLGRDPYGFLGKFQAFSANWEDAAVGIVKLLINHNRMYNEYLNALRACPDRRPIWRCLHA